MALANAVERLVDTVLERYQRIAQGRLTDKSKDASSDGLVPAVRPGGAQRALIEAGNLQGNRQLFQIGASQLTRSLQHGNQCRNLVAVFFEITGETIQVVIRFAKIRRNTDDFVWLLRNRNGIALLARFGIQ
ncbi:hypothetical protein D3C87_1593060 [compost metagenome]